jgi:DNA end-binding protein Ku
MRGKENLVAVRAYQGGLILHTLYFADEVRDFGEIDIGKASTRREEKQLALRLVQALRRPAFDPAAFEDTYRARVEKAARAKARGKALPEGRPAAGSDKVVDLMEALQRSLERRPAKAGGRAASGGARKAPARRKAS